MVKRYFNYKIFLVLLLSFISVYLLFNTVVIPYRSAVSAVTFKYGSKGDYIYVIQDKLKRWGFYKGNIDGVYGYQTYLAVKAFQQKNGLKADGIAGNSTLVSLGIFIPGENSNTSNTYAAVTSSRSTTNDATVKLLASLINGESRGEPYEGQVAVGAVVLNRTRDSRFPKTIAGVIYQPGAFTATVDGQISAKLEQTSINAARDALNGWDPSGGAVYYFNPAKATNAWIWSRPLIKIIGKHRFCS
ncbi:MAG: spore cortex-lytic enzyme [Clostridiaceae bacterium]|nr:spore cortex-lytic enzyme [Clostridiaceae bacterium]